MKTYELASYITRFSFFCTLLTNSFLIFLTIFHIKLITGTYKTMIVIFATLGIILSFLEIMVQPSTHNFNGGFMYFSLNERLPKNLVFGLTACYSGVYCSLLAFVAMQFTFRCWTLLRSKLVKSFKGWRLLLWLLFLLTPNFLFSSGLVVLMSPDDYSDGYMKEEILKIYELGIKDVPRFTMLVYNAHGGLRWKNVGCVITLSSILTFNLTIIAYSAYRMRKEMHNCMKLMSTKNQKLETQFFFALLAQGAFPTFLLALPTGPVMAIPFFDMKISLQTGFLFSMISLYPPMDSIAMMMIIKEYKTCVRGLIHRLRDPSCFYRHQKEPGNFHSDLGNSFQLSVL